MAGDIKESGDAVVANMGDRGHRKEGGYVHDEVNLGSHFTPEEIEFGRAVFDYRRRHGVAFPALSDLLKILRALGYRKVAPRGPMP